MTSSRSHKATVSGPARSRFFLVKGTILFLFALLGARLVYVQGFLRTELQGKANLEQGGSTGDRGIRNYILDRNFQILAESVPVTSCFVDPKRIKNLPSTVKTVAGALGMDADGLEKKIKKTSGSFLWLKRDISAAEVAALRGRKLPGVAFRQELRRHYPFGDTASHLLGMVGIDGQGLSGIECVFDSTLNGKPLDPAKKNAYPKGDIQLTIDTRFQEIAEKELDWGARKIGAKTGMVIIQDPWTGDILAMASWPPISLDPDDPPDPKEMRIPGIMDVFEPGSTFKVVTAAAAIEEKRVSPTEIFDGEKGAWKVSSIVIHDHEPKNRMTLEDVMVYSSNVGTAKIGERLGPEKLFQYARLFGFGVYSGCGVGGEAKGVLRLPSKWSGVSKYVVSFGQEVGVTAVQLVGAYSAIANGGVLMEPRIVHAILNEDKGVRWQSSPARVRQAVSHETAAKLTTILTQVVERGTGVNAKIQWNKEIKVAGKTGTAQKYDLKARRYSDKLTLVSFCGFFPADNPRVTMLVILDEPEGRRWGGSDAAPVFRRIAERLLPMLDLTEKKKLEAV